MANCCVAVVGDPGPTECAILFQGAHEVFFVSLLLSVSLLSPAFGMVFVFWRCQELQLSTDVDNGQVLRNCLYNVP